MDIYKTELERMTALAYAWEAEAKKIHAEVQRHAQGANGWFQEAQRLKRELNQANEDATAFHKEAQILRGRGSHEENELRVADKIIRQLRAENDAFRARTRDLENKVEQLTPPRKRLCTQYGRYEPLTIVRATSSYEDIMHSMEATAMSLEAESEEQLARICALFDTEPEILEELGRGGVTPGSKMPRPGAWTLKGLAMRAKTGV